MPTAMEGPAVAAGAERRILPRLEPDAEQFVFLACDEGLSTRAQVLDFNRQGLRLLFRPAIDLHPGMTVQIGDVEVKRSDPAAVIWCHHKHHFTVAAVRVIAERFSWIGFDGSPTAGTP